MKELKCPTEKKPFAALILSLFFPGLGQLYNTETTKGIVIAGSCLVLGLGTWWLSGVTRLSVGLALLVVIGGLLLFFTIPYLVSWLFAQRPELKPLLEQHGLQP